MPVSLHFYLKHHYMYSYNTLFSKFVLINCPDISKSKSWFPDKNDLFACLPRNLSQFSSQPRIHHQKKSDNLGALDLSVYVLHLVTVATNVFTHTRSSCTWCGVLKSAPWLQVIYTLSHSIRYR